MCTGSLNPFALINLFSAGVICVTLTTLKGHKTKAVAEDGWEIFDAPVLFPSVTSAEDDAFLRQLDFLVNHKFVLATCRLGTNSTLYIRIYLIPFDLSNVQGRLRTRDELVMTPARKYLSVLLPRIVQDTRPWDARDLPPSPIKYLLPQNLDNRTMAEIYSDLPSPTVNPGSAGPLASELISGLRIDGLSSTLHRYQRRSVAAMVQRELYPCDILDPLYVPITGMDGKTFYFQPAKLEVLRECPVVSQGRGGVLCEELGTGKTVMTLALVLATRDQISSPEDSILDTRPVVTPLAFRHFPSEPYRAARKRASRSANGAYQAAAHAGVPSLLEIMIHYVRAFPEGLDLQSHEEELRNHHLWDLIALNAPFYHHYDIELPITPRSRRHGPDIAPRVMFLTSATIIIVPTNLLGQWESEINKHCDSASTPRVLVLQKENVIPPAKDMASDYDIILMTHTRFSSESKKSNVQQLHAWSSCCCSNYPDQRARVPNCHCNTEVNVSPLLQIRWKRLVIDEGHVSATMATNLTPFAKLLSVERKWIVTGTPTTNLLGLGFGRGDNDADSFENSGDVLKSRSSEALLDKGDAESCPVARRWTKDDREDLRKLATMINHFLAVPHFAADPKLFDSHIIAPLLHQECPQPGAIRVLEQVMSMVMIRHRVNDIESDISLPPIKHDTVLLDLGSFSVKSYNAMQAMFVINAVDSHRVDQDYFFHKRNAAPLSLALQNLSQIMFWHTDSNLYNIAPRMAEGKQAMLDDPKHTEISENDRRLLHRAFEHLTAAFHDNAWRAMQARSEVFYRIHNLPEGVLRTWSLLSQSPDSPPGPHCAFIHPDALLELRRLVNEHPLASEDRIKEWGDIFHDEERRRNALYLESLQKRKKGKAKDGSDSWTDTEKALLKRVKPPPSAKSSIQSSLPDDDSKVQDSVIVVPRAPPPDPVTSKAALLTSSPVAGVRIGTSTSSKLNYILREVQQYGADEKFLIFSSSPLTLAHIAEGLDLIRVKHLTYTSQLKPKEREHRVLTFETSKTFRVFLMELKHGARGLNLVTASRVIFCEPIWRADVESQAIKRAHRIGQTRPITVKTLAIRATMEEMMISRRSAAQETGKVSNNWAEESGMRYFIANPTFLGTMENESIRPLELSIPLIEVPLVPEPLPPADCVMMNVEVTPDVNSDLGTPLDVNRPQKKRRVVRFADDL